MLETGLLPIDDERIPAVLRPFFQTGKIELWSPNMHLTMEAMEELGLMSTKATWLQEARNKMKRIIPKIPEEGEK